MYGTSPYLTDSYQHALMSITNCLCYNMLLLNEISHSQIQWNISNFIFWLNSQLYICFNKSWRCANRGKCGAADFIKTCALCNFEAAILHHIDALLNPPNYTIAFALDNYSFSLILSPLHYVSTVWSDEVNYFLYNGLCE